MIIRTTSQIVISLLIGLASACSSTGPKDDGAPEITPIEVENIPNVIPQNEPLSKYGNPSKYVVFGKTYYVQKSSKGYVKKGKASWYGTKFHGRRTSSGVPYDMFKMTAAHKTLPLPTYVEVHNLDNGKKIIVKVNDRGPFHEGRIIDLSYVAALKLDIVKAGTGNVEVTALSTERKVKLSSFVQVGAFNDKLNAAEMQLKLTREELVSEISKVVISARKHIYRVRIGPLDDQEELNRVLNTLQRIGIDDAKVLSN